MFKVLTITRWLNRKVIKTQLIYV